MPVWLVLGVQSSARRIVVNGCEAELFNEEHTDPETGWVGPVVPEPAAPCCQINAPTTTIISSTGMPMLAKSRARVFIISILSALPCPRSRPLLPRHAHTFEQRYKSKQHQP